MSTIEILIADGNSARGTRVACALEAAGHPCEIVTHGAAALEVALAEHPRVIVAEANLALVDAGQLAEILRANPRTRAVRFLFLGAESTSGLLGGVGDASLDGEIETDDVLDAIAGLLERQERVETLEDRTLTEPEFSGALSEIGPAELLQMLHVRHATGRLRLDHEVEASQPYPAQVSFCDGEIFAAELGPIRGEKALFRMLDWRSGTFDFAPEEIAGEAEILSPTRSLLAEGLRQLDEWNRLAPKLPPFESPVRLCVAPGDLPQLVHPLTQEVLQLLEEYDRVGDVVDHCSRSDYQVLRTLHTLSERGIAEFGRGQIAASEPDGDGALLNEGLINRLRNFAQMGLARDEAAPDAKLLVVPASRSCLERFASTLAKIGCIELAPNYADAGSEWKDLETLARVDVDGEFGIDLIHLPAEPRSEAVAGLAAHRALGTLVLLDAGVGESSSRVATISDSLTARPGSRNFNVVMLSEGERIAPEELRDNLSLIDQASLFLLPSDGNKDSASLLRSLFARIVP
jgi:CheY-like chemotaxis protein